ncbi:MAG: enoyl-CoA hydratase-related protein, partial [Acidimicrobiia bacterium]
MIRYIVDGAVATLTIDDPDRRNALTNEAMAELSEALGTACGDGDVRVIVVTGAGDRAFSAGGDLSGGFVDAPLAGHGDRGALANLIRGMRRCPKPVVGRVNGHALGGGLGLVAGCDIAIAAESATFGTPEIGVGLWPMMITAVLRPLVPRRPLLEMMLTGRRFGAKEAAHLGIVNRVVLADELDSAVEETVDAL